MKIFQCIDGTADVVTEVLLTKVWYVYVGHHRMSQTCVGKDPDNAG